jgi:putative PIN family toxin of toxin-antitoxin system
LRALFDTNVLIAAFISEGVCAKLMRRARKRQFSLISSPLILREFQDVLMRKFSATRRESQEALQVIMEAVEAMTQSEQAVTGACRDPEDDQILGCALAGKVDYLVTGDEDLLVIKQFKAIRIITPRDFELLFED